MSNFVSYRARFKGDLGGVDIDKLKGLDFNIENMSSRRKFLVGKCEEIKPFTDEYFNTKENDSNDNGEFDNLEQNTRLYFNYRPNVTDELSEDINVCKHLQAYGSYLLNSKDLPRESQQQYNILTEEEFEKVLKKEQTLEVSGTGNAIDILDQKPTNDYTNLNHRITNADFKDPEIKDVLIDYEKYKQHLKSEMEKIKSGEGSYLDLYKIRTLLSGINDDMIQSKIKIKQIRNQAKRLGDETPYNDHSKMDYSNPTHVKAILKYIKMSTPRPDSETSHIGYDLMMAVNKLRKSKEIDKIDLEIIECYNSGNYSLDQIGQEVNMKKQSVDKRLGKICNKISKIM